MWALTCRARASNKRVARKDCFDAGALPRIGFDAFAPFGHGDEMGKYDPLGGYLRRQRQADLELTFPEIERILGAMLPKRATRSQWWANGGDPGAGPALKAWRDAGYNAFLIANQERVRFVRSS